MKIVLNAKNALILLFCLILVGFAVFVVTFAENLFIRNSELFLTEPEQDCVFNIEERIVQGNSLSGLIEDGQMVRVFFGYYDCNEIKREDIILYNYPDSQNLLVKVVKGIPGDTFGLQRSDDDPDRNETLNDVNWHILINGEILKNSEGIPYLISGERYEVLFLCEKEYRGVIPENAYLIMGNLVGGATDSTLHCLFHKNDILAKVELLAD